MESLKLLRIATLKNVHHGVPGQTGHSAQPHVGEVRSLDKEIVYLTMARLEVIILVALATLMRQWSVMRTHVLCGHHGATGQSVVPRVGVVCSCGHASVYCHVSGPVDV